MDRNFRPERSRAAAEAAGIAKTTRSDALQPGTELSGVIFGGATVSIRVIEVEQADGTTTLAPHPDDVQALSAQFRDSNGNRSTPF